MIQARTIGRLTDEAAIRQAEHEGKVRALTRRLVGVASSQMLEQDGLAERLTDIITRQVELENRDAALASTLERALAGSATPPPDAPARAEDSARQPPMRKGSATERTFAGQTLREQFDQIETGLGRVETRQFGTVEHFLAFARARIERVRGAFAELQLALAPEPVSPPSRPASDPRPAFALALAGADAALGEAVRWRALAETVPLRPPIEGEVGRSSNFGTRSDPFTGERRMHAGMDFRSPVGTVVHATASGRVITAGPSGGYGNLVEVNHGNGLVTRYAHLSATGVSVGQAVPAGAVVGAVGSTGRSTGPHLHYETRLSGNPLDPLRFLTAGERVLRPLVRTDATPEADAAEAAD
ncbi:murein DD-endopeptidase MepM/ murein hydrolase activator NlpD [Methylobacterium brachiatum]|uniref:Murein DD-endopeptidase MepM/ murein hydrolase activator NlpD n=1 Tax=Methylobacterium brachiatum TaxID=269660 RepID=A0AAJ1WXG4_9HYPH|nr:M23 family metallopeptidase [Methylobacterium brachiatum]MCB4805517.1 M23 family metallopeptidase [Methylobacterium brachiatum]MDQ0546569.1 murein DD-endopeptidase MepM/ murein hydrolase activator NlpD [Methylobacterium brachiatum]